MLDFFLTWGGGGRKVIWRKKFPNNTVLFSITRRSRSDVSDWLTEWSLADFTDVTLVSEDAFYRIDWYDSGEWGYLLETWLMLAWWVMITKEDFIYVTLASDDTF